MHAALERFWTTLDQALPPGPDPEWRAGFATAVGEIAANIVRHAHPEGGYRLAPVPSTVDRLQYERTPSGQNQWRLVKRLSG